MTEGLAPIPFYQPTERDHLLRAIEIACEQPGGEHFKLAVARLDREEMVTQLAVWSTLRYGQEGMLRSTLYRPGDRLQREMQLRHSEGGSGAVDLAIHHADGGVSLIEVKDGRTGWRSTAAGIGQVCGYAAMAEAMGIEVKSKILLWSPVPRLGDQECIFSACRHAGVAPVLGWGVDQVLDFIRSLSTRTQRSIIEQHCSQVGWPAGMKE